MNSQILKGVLEGCVLAIIARGETYGYELASQLSAAGLDGISEGTLYPLLLRLERKGLIASRTMPSDRGPRRKYYALTPDGREQLQLFQDDYRCVRQAVDKLLGEG